MTSPEEMPVVPCTADELAPLLDGLRRPLPPPIEPHIQFVKGTIVRQYKVLDLCKQVVGPKGIGPLLGAMKECDEIERLLIGNNITGPEGAREIASHIADPNSRISTWYVFQVTLHLVRDVPC